MGLFDYVNYEMPCPKCGTEITEFQTKDGDSYMKTVEYWQVGNFYGSCPKCEAWVEFTLRSDAKPRPITDYEMTVTEGD